MLDSLFIHTTKVSRRASTTVNALMEQVYTYTDAYAAQACRIEQYNEKVEYRKSGERPTNSTLIYYPSTVTIQKEDRIYQGSTYLGLVIAVNPALDSAGSIDHYEIFVENP